MWRLLTAALMVLATAPLSAAASRSPALPDLAGNGIGSVHFGVPQARAVSSLEASLGKPTSTGINTGCGTRFIEVAWRDLDVEFRSGKFTGYRFLDDGWPLTTVGSPRDRATSKQSTPRLSTANGITLGSTLRQLHRAYGGLKRSGATTWTAANGLTFSESPKVSNPDSSGNQITEIKGWDLRRLLNLRVWWLLWLLS